MKSKKFDTDYDAAVERERARAIAALARECFANGPTPWAMAPKPAKVVLGFARSAL